MIEDEKPNIQECLQGIDSSLASIAESLVEISALLYAALDDDGDGIIGRTDRIYGGKKFVRTLPMRD